MARIEKTVFCDGCGAEITWAPILFKTQEFCCQDCAHGIPCTCGERMELGDEMRAARSLPLTGG